MARRKLTLQQELEIAARARNASDAGADVVRRPGGATRGPNASAVLSVRVPIEQMQGLRALAARRGVSLSDVVHDAIATFAAAGGAHFYKSSGSSWTLYTDAPPRSEAYNLAPISRPEDSAGTRSLAVVS